MKPVFISILILVNCTISNAQQFDPDYHTAFSGKATNNIYAVQADGKVIVAGNYFTYANGTIRFGIARINNDGSLDQGFNAGDGPDYYIDAIQITANNKIFVAGRFSSFNGTTAHSLVRLNNDGSVDNTFDAGSGFNGYIYDLDTALNGKLYVAGTFTHYNTSNVINLIRINTDGSLDSTFQAPVIPSYPTIISAQPDSSLYIELPSTNEIKKLSSDGTVDGSFIFGGHTLTSGFILSMLVEPDGVIIGGTFTDIDNAGNAYIAKILNNGTLDNSFHPGNKLDGQVEAMAGLPEGKIVIGGNFHQYDNVSAGLVTLNPDGSLSSILGSVSSGLIHYMTVDQNLQQIIVGGEFDSYNNMECGGLIKLNNYHTTDTNFTPEFTNYGPVGVMALDYDGKILVDGQYVTINNNRQALWRLNSDGTIDSLFNPQIADWTAPYAIQPLDDGSILVGGSLRDKYSNLSSSIFKLNHDGSLDNTFTTGQFLSDAVGRIVVDGNGKILVGGPFAVTGNGYGIARLNADGTLDNTFHSAFGEGTFVTEIELADSGKYYVSGGLNINGTNMYRVVRIKQDGQLDEGFNLNPAPDDLVYRIIVLPGGKILIGGSFRTLDGAISKQIARLNYDGSIDNSFSTVKGFQNHEDNPMIMDMNIDSDGSIYAGGIFNTYNAASHIGIVKLDSTGAPDDQFVFNNLDFPSDVRRIIFTPDNDLYLAGSIVIKSSGTSQHIVRAINPPAAPSDLIAVAMGSTTSMITWSDNSDNETTFNKERKKSEEDFNVIAIIDPNSELLNDDNLDPNSIYYYRVKAMNGGLASPYSNEDSALTLLTTPVITASDSITAHTLHLAWNSVEGAELYGIDISKDRFLTIPAGYENLTQTATQTMFGALDENTQYFIRLQARNSYNHSFYSDTVIINTLPTVPAAPSGLNITTNQDDNIVVNWTDNSDNENGFIIERKEGDGDYVTIDTVDANSVQYVDESAGFNVQYSYRVESYRKGAGTSAGVTVASDPSNESGITVTGFESNPANSLITLYPNPTASIIYISSHDPGILSSPIRLYDTDGRIVNDFKLSPNRNFIDMRSMTRGTYILIIDNNGMKVSKRIIKN